MIEQAVTHIQLLMFFVCMFTVSIVMFIQSLYVGMTAQQKLRQIDAELKLNYAQIIYLTMQEIHEEKRKNDEQ
jgi:hypothetical protein